MTATIPGSGRLVVFPPLCGEDCGVGTHATAVADARAVRGGSWEQHWSMYAIIGLLTVATSFPVYHLAGEPRSVMLTLLVHVLGKLLIACVAVRAVRSLPTARSTEWVPRLRRAIASTLVSVGVVSAGCLVVQTWAFAPTPAAGWWMLLREAVSAMIVLAVAAVLTSVARMLRGLRRQAEFDRHLQREIVRANLACARANMRLADASLSPSLLSLAIRSAVADIPHDPDRASRTLLAAADVLRDAIAAGELTEVPLLDEREAIDRFFTTVTGRAIVRWEIAADCTDLLVSRSLLWVLVVTALGVRHDVRRLVVVSASRGTWTIDVWIDDDDAAVTSNPDPAAVSAIAGRLALQFGSRVPRVRLLDPEGRAIRVTLPLASVSLANVPRASERTPRLLWSQGPRVPSCRQFPRVTLVGLGLALAFAVESVLMVRAAAWPSASFSATLLQVVLACWRGAGVAAAIMLAVLAAQQAPLGLSTLGRRALRTNALALCGTVLVVLFGWVLEAPLFHLASAHLRMALPAASGGWRVLSAVIVFVVVSLTAHADVYVMRRRVALTQWRVQRARRSQARAATRDAELRALSAELAPHFVGNALHAALCILHDAPAEATRLLSSLQLLADRVAARSMAHEVSLHDEIQSLDPFLEIERARMGAGRGDLLVSVEVEAGLGDVRVPRFVLQPLVENAVRHGIVPRGRCGHIVIRAFRQGASRVVLEVADDGVGPRVGGDRVSVGAGLGCGTGTRVVRRRLAALYGRQASYSLTAGPVGGSVARLELPVPAR